MNTASTERYEAAAAGVATGAEVHAALRAHGITARETFRFYGAMRLLALGSEEPGDLTGWMRERSASEVADTMRKAARLVGGMALTAAQAEAFIARRQQAEAEAGPDVEPVLSRMDDPSVDP